MHVFLNTIFLSYFSGPRVNLAKLYQQSSNNPQRVTNIHLEPVFTEDPDVRA